jgi:hypothetical protein
VELRGRKGAASPTWVDSATGWGAHGSETVSDAIDDRAIGVSASGALLIAKTIPAVFGFRASSFGRDLPIPWKRASNIASRITRASQACLHRKKRWID